MFSLKAYLYPASISIPALEHGLYALRNSYSVDHRIAEAYRAPAGMEPRFDVIHSEDQLRKMVAMYEEKEPVDRASLRRAFMGE